MPGTAGESRERERQRQREKKTQRGKQGEKATLGAWNYAT